MKHFAPRALITGVGRWLLAAFASLAACTDDATPVDPDAPVLALVQAKLGDDPNRLLSIDLPRVPIATGGRGGYGLQRGDGLDGAARLSADAQLEPAVEATLSGDALTTIGIDDGARTFTIAVDDAEVAVTEIAQTVAAAIARPDLTGTTRIERWGWTDRGAPARFTTAAEVPVTIGLLAASGQRLLDLDVAVASGAWRSDGPRLILTAPAVGITVVPVTSGAVTVDLAVEVIAAADELRVHDVACAGANVVNVCATAWSGGRDVVAYDWTWTTQAPATLAAPPGPSNCVAVTVPAGTASVTLEARAGNHVQELIVTPPC